MLQWKWFQVLNPICGFLPSPIERSGEQLVTPLLHGSGSGYIPLSRADAMVTNSTPSVKLSAFHMLSTGRRHRLRNTMIENVEGQ